MKLIRRLTLASILLCLLTTSTLAGDFATLNFIGFSKDGRYLAFEEFGTQDGSGFPYSNVYVVDVVKNVYASKPVAVRIDDEKATERLARSRSKLGASSAFRKFGILAGNTGKLVVSRQLTDLSVNHFLSEHPGDTQKIKFAEIVGSMYQGGDWELILKSVAVKTKDCAYVGEDSKVYMLDLSIHDNEGNRTTTLQKDSALPSGRGCPTNYAMQYVYLYQDYAAVFVSKYTIGFEGPDMRYMVVTGKIK